MKTLIKRDIRVIGILIHLTLIGAGIVYTPTMLIIEDKYVVLWIGIILVSFMVGLIHIVLEKEDNNAKMNMVLNSLPIEKSTIVGSRYATIMIYIVATSILVFISSHFLMFGVIIVRNNKSIALGQLVWLAGINILVYSLYLPINYKLKDRVDENREYIVVAVILLVLLARISMKSNNIIYRYMSNIDFTKIPLRLIGFSLLAYIASLFISIKIYGNKEF